MSLEERDDLITAETAIENEQEISEEVLSEELDTQEGEPESIEEESSEDPEVVERAKKYGHLSKEEWVAQGRNPKDWKSPEEFDKTGKVIEQIYSLKKKVDQRDIEIQALIEYQERTKQREYERAKQELEARLEAAEEDMDVKGVRHYTKELVRLEDLESNNKVQQLQKAQQSAQQAFIERNQHWFNDRNPDLKQRAVEIDNEIQAEVNAGRLKINSYDDIAVMIEKRLSYEHPDRVLNTPKQTRPIVSNSSVNKSAAVNNNTKKTFQSLPQELKDTFNAYKRIKSSMGQELTEAEFIQRLKDDGEL